MKGKFCKMKRVLRNSMLFGLVSMITLGFLFPGTTSLTAFATEKSGVTTDTPIIYDIYDLTGKDRVTFDGPAEMLELPSNENIGLKFKLEINQTLTDRGRVPLGFMSKDVAGWGRDDYTFLFEWDTSLYVRGVWTEGTGKVANGGSMFKSSGTYEILVSFANYYEGGVRKGTKVCCTVDGEEVISYVDKSEGYADMGRYVTWDENCKADYKDGKVTLKSSYSSVDIVKKMIDRLPPVREIKDADGEAIKIAREKFNALTEEEQELVTNYSVLVAAESTFEQVRITRTYDTAKVYDLYDIAGTGQVDCVSGSSDFIGRFPNGQNSNVALRFRLKLNQKGKDHARFAIGFMEKLNEKDGDACYGGTSYNIGADWGWKIFSRKMITNSADATGWNAEETINMKDPSISAIIEIGCVKYYENGVWSGNKIYVKVDGEERVSYIDKEQGYQDMGTGITWNKTSREWEDLNGNISVSDLNAVKYTVDKIPEGVNIRKEIIVVRGKENINIATDTGVFIDKLTLNGNNITSTLEKVPGGYTIQTKKLSGGGKLAFKTSMKNCSIRVNETSDAEIRVSASVPFGGSTEIKITPKVGKKVTSVSINGKEMIESFQYKKGVLSFKLYDILKDTSINMTCEDKSYDVSIVKAKHGDIKADVKRVQANGSVTLSVIPDKGYYVKSITCNDKPIALDENGTCVMEYVSEDINVKTVFEKKANIPQISKVSSGDVSNRVILIGISAGSIVIIGTLIAVAFIVKRKKSSGNQVV